MNAIPRARRPILLYLLFWNAAWAALITADLPLSRLPLDSGLKWLANAALLNLSFGLLIVSFVYFVARQLRGAALVGSVLVGGIIMAVLQAIVEGSQTLTIFEITVPLYSGERPRLPAVLDGAWRILISSGLVLVACIWERRSEETRMLLEQAEIARGVAAGRSGRAQLQTLQSEVDPALLRQVLAEVQRRYASDAAAADRLLDKLVSFLRAAMPGVRSGTSTLGGELSLACRAAELHNNLAAGEPWRSVEVRGPLPDGLPFPPLLLPLLQQLASATPAGAPLQLVASTDESEVRVALCGGGVDVAWLNASLEYRLRVALSTLYGADARVLVSDGSAPGEPALLLRLPCRTTPTCSAARSPAVPVPVQPKESHHG